MPSQVRTYTIHPGMLEEFTALWREHIVPAREAYGFTVEGAWAGQDTFVWVVAHDGDFEAADAAYYDSPERAALPRSPADFLADVQTRLLERVR